MIHLDNVFISAVLLPLISRSSNLYFFAFLRRTMKLIVNALNEISDHRDKFYTDLMLFSCLSLRSYFLGNSTFSLLRELQARLTLIWPSIFNILYNYTTLIFVLCEIRTKSIFTNRFTFMRYLNLYKILQKKIVLILIFYFIFNFFFIYFLSIHSLLCKWEYSWYTHMRSISHEIYKHKLQFL